MSRSDRAWESWGALDPYFAVLSAERFRSKNLSQDALQEFFQSGERHVENVFETIRLRLDSAFAPRSAVEFGCGTGRLLIPLARRIPTVVGVDISSTMLLEAQRNCDEQSVTNVQFVKSDDELSGLRGQYDLVHSSLVFQHIPHRRGQRILGRLLKHVSPGGIAVLDFVYNREVPKWRKVLAWIRQRSWMAHGLANLLQSRNLSNRLIPMHVYSLNSVVTVLQQGEIRDIYCQFLEHPNEYRGIALYCRRRAP